MPLPRVRLEALENKAAPQVRRSVLCEAWILIAIDPTGNAEAGSSPRPW